METPAYKRTKVQSTTRFAATGEPILLDSSHAVAIDGKKIYTTEIMSPAPSATVLSNNAPFSFIVENDSAGILQDCVLRFTIEVLAGGFREAVLPPALWFDRIEWYDRHTGREIARRHGDIIHWLTLALGKDETELIEKACHFDSVTGGINPVRHVVDEIKNYYLVLPHLWLEGFDLDLSILKGDLEIKFYPRGDIRATPATGVTGYTGSAAQFLLREVRWIGGSELSSVVGRLQFREEKMRTTRQHNYFDVQQYVEAGKTITAGQEFTVNLDQFHHQSAALLFVLRSDTDVAANGPPALKYLSIGARGTIDHEGTHGRSLLGDGTPLDETYMRTFVTPQLFGSNISKHNAIYCIPFTKDMRGVLQGQIDGFHEFRGDRERLRILPGPAGTTSTYQLAFSGGVNLSNNTSRLLYRGEQWFVGNLQFVTYQTLNYRLNQCPAVIRDNLMITITELAGGGTGFAGVVSGGGLLTWLVDMKQRGTGLAAQFDETSARIEADRYPGTAGSIQNMDYGLLPSSPHTGGFLPPVGTVNITIYSIYYRHILESMGRLEVEDV